MTTRILALLPLALLAGLVACVAGAAADAEEWQ